MVVQDKPRTPDDLNDGPFPEVWGMLSTPLALKSLRAIERSAVEPKCTYIDGNTAGYLDVHLPGVSPGDISVQVDRNERTLSVSGRRVKTITLGEDDGINEADDPELIRKLQRVRKEYMKPGRRIHVVTRVYKKVFSLHTRIFVDGVEIDDYCDGVMRIRIPFRTDERVLLR